MSFWAKATRSLASDVAVLVINVPCYLFVVWYARRHPEYYWEIIVGWVFVIIITTIHENAPAKGE